MEITHVNTFATDAELQKVPTLYILGFKGDVRSTKEHPRITSTELHQALKRAINEVAKRAKTEYSAFLSPTDVWIVEGVNSDGSKRYDYHAVFSQEPDDAGKNVMRHLIEGFIAGWNANAH